MPQIQLDGGAQRERQAGRRDGGRPSELRLDGAALRLALGDGS